MTTQQDNRRYNSTTQQNDRRYRSTQQTQSPNSEQTISPHADQTVNPNVDQNINQNPELSINPQVDLSINPQVEQNMSPKFEQHINLSFESKSESPATQNGGSRVEHPRSQPAHHRAGQQSSAAQRHRPRAQQARSQPPRRQANHQSGRTSATLDEGVDLVRTSRIVWALVGALQTLIALRIFLKLIGVNPESGFASFIYGITEVFLLPFSALMGTPAANGSVLEISSFIAMIAYAVMGGIVVRLMRAAS